MLMIGNGAGFVIADRYRAHLGYLLNQASSADWLPGAGSDCLLASTRRSEADALFLVGGRPRSLTRGTHKVPGNPEALESSVLSSPQSFLRLLRSCKHHAA
jgi:hypothetical protein